MLVTWTLSVNYKGSLCAYLLVCALGCVYIQYVQLVMLGARCVACLQHPCARKDTQKGVEALPISSGHRGVCVYIYTVCREHWARGLQHCCVHDVNKPEPA